jgi:hypothetical protein
MKKIILIYLLVIYTIFATPEEILEKTNIKIGEIIEYRVKGLGNDCELPNKDFLYSEKDSENPLAEIIDITKNQDELVIKIIFFQEGSFNFPFNCKNKEIFSSKINIEVSSGLSGEKELLDISEPILFSGNYIKRLILFSLLIIFIFAIASYFIWKINFKKKLKVTEAYFSDSLNLIQNLDYSIRIKALIQELEIPHKEFIFLLTGYIKEKIEKKVKYPIQHFTQAELDELLLNIYKLEQIELLKNNMYFNSVKYMPNDELISYDKAISLISYWDRVLK